MGAPALPDMTPRLEACYFTPRDPREARNWARLARLLQHTAATQCPDWTIAVIELPAPTHVLDGFHANTVKLDQWCQVVEAAPEGARLLLIDVDTVIVRPLDDVWAQPFDVAYTVRTTSRFPFNAGVVFVRVSAVSRRFFQVWRDENRRLLADARRHREWRVKYGGMNQAALGSILEQRLAPEARLHQLPCAEWNCEDTSWASYDPAVTRILHVKSALRRMVFGYAATTPALRPLVAFWRRLEAEAVTETVERAG